MPRSSNASFAPADGRIYPGLSDSHLHGASMVERGMDHRAILAWCFDQGMRQVVDIGLHPRDVAARRSLYEGTVGVYLTAGLSPDKAATEGWREGIDELTSILGTDGIVAVGEIGLDWHRDYGSRKGQTDLFTAQLDLAASHDLPVVIHNRDADEDMLEILPRFGPPRRGIMHCFSSSPAVAIQFAAMGYMISFAGNLTYPSAGDIRLAAAAIPQELLLLETDSPYLAPQPLRGKPNCPAYLGHTCDLLAEIRGCSPQEIARATGENLARLLALD